MSSRTQRQCAAIGVCGATAFALLVSGTLLAQPAPSVPDVAAPPVHPATSVMLAPGSEDLSEGELLEHQADERRDEARVQRRSPAMIATGIVLTALGGINLLAGIGIHVEAEDIAGDSDKCRIEGMTDPAARDQCGATYAEDLRTGATIMGVAGGVAVAIGIPMIVLGAEKKGQNDEPTVAQALIPTLEVRPTGATVSWQF